MKWSNVTGGVPLIKVQWSKSQPSLFYALDVASKMHVWDLSRDNTGPLASCHFLQGRYNILFLKMFLFHGDYYMGLFTSLISFDCGNYYSKVLMFKDTLPIADSFVLCHVLMALIKRIDFVLHFFCC